jgi:integrase
MPSPPKSPGVRRVRKRLADGTIKVYEYQRAASAPHAPTKGDTIRDLIAAYERSPEWAALKPRTVKARLAALRHIMPVSHLTVAGLRRKALLELRDAIAVGIGPGAANAFAANMAALLSWARERGWIEYSPADRIKALRGGHFPTWTEDDFAAAMDAATPALKRALMLAVHTGQRRGDLIAARWPDMAGGVWRLRQEKTGARLAIPLHPDLAADMATWPRDAVTVLATEAKTPWDRDALTMAVMRLMEGIGRKGLNVHGLRKLAAVRLAEAGASVHEIAAVTGHASLAQVALYTRDVDQARLARAAVVRLPTTAGNRRKG